MKIFSPPLLALLLSTTLITAAPIQSIDPALMEEETSVSTEERRAVSKAATTVVGALVRAGIKPLETQVTAYYLNKHNQQDQLEDETDHKEDRKAIDVEEGREGGVEEEKSIEKRQCWSTIWNSHKKPKKNCMSAYGIYDDDDDDKKDD